MAKANPFLGSTKFYDWNTELYNYGHRVHKPATGTWSDRDSIGENGGINLYRFVGNNPVNFVDPFGLLTLLVPGTQFTHSSSPYFEPSFVAAVGKTFGETPQVWNWSGEDNDSARRVAGMQLAQYLRNYKKVHPCEQIIVVAHSHGGNVAFLASRLASIDEIVTLGTPIREYQPNFNNIGDLINVYSTSDSVQSHGGGEHNVWVEGQGEYGSANRTLPENDQVENVQVQTESSGTSAHSELHTPGVWNQVFPLQ
jgi:RHS repeat-associated protein